MTDKLKVFRAEIDVIDRQLADLLEARFKLSEKIGELKRQTGAAVYDRRREQKLLAGLNERVTAPYRQNIGAVYQTILEESKKIQR